MPPLTAEQAERVKLEVQVVLDQHGYLTKDEEGTPVLTDNGDPKVDLERIGESIAERLVSGAVAETAKDRLRVMLTRDQLVETAFPNAIRRPDWSDQPDSDLAQLVWNELDTICWTLCNIKPNATVQQMLNGQNESPFVLARMKPVRPGQPWGVYVTRDQASLQDDIIRPMQEAEARRARQDARQVELLMRRIPDHAETFQKALNKGLKTAQETGKRHTEGVLLSLGVGVDE